MQYPGYIAVAIKYVNGNSAVYKVGLSALNPSPAYMVDHVFMPDRDTIQLFGRLLDDNDETEYWFRVPATSYSSVSWKWYTQKELDAQIDKKRKQESSRLVYTEVQIP